MLERKRSRPRHQCQVSSNTAFPDKWEPFNFTNPNPLWCPWANCTNSPLCSPCNRRYLLILATGRSGSTTLLHMLNQLPGVRLSGENNNILYAASKVLDYANGKEMRTGRKDFLLDPNKPLSTGAWARHIVPAGAMSCSLQSILNTVNPPPPHVLRQSNISFQEYDQHTILGAKMIRLQQGEWRPKRAAKFLRENFPCARVVVNIRSDAVAQATSMTQYFKGSDKIEFFQNGIAEETNFLKALAKELGPDMAKLLDMNQWTQDEGGLEVLNNLINWMGFRGCKFKELLHENVHGYHRDGRKFNLGEKCRLAEDK